jgi:DNA primase
VEPTYDINDNVKREVLAATDIVALIGASTSLKKVGRSWKGLCPFHGEKTPSFYVHPEKGFYYCFGCGAKGDAITFVRETERLEFPEAMAYLARRVGITLPERRSGTRAERAKETGVAAAVGAAAAFFRKQLPRHPEAVALLSKRGLDVDEASGFGIGAAPDAWDALKSALSGSVAEETLLAAGLLQKSESGRVYDRFRNRLTIEISDGRGEVLGFGARALGDETPKYLNSPESSRFSKGKLLYGLDRAREAIRKTDTVILVEGYFDRIAFEKAGVSNAVASMGTSLTPAQADLLARQAATVVVAYDGDPPGQTASHKAFPLLLSRGASVKHMVLPDGHDPDSFLAARGAEALRAEVERALPLLEALLAGIPAGGDAGERAARVNDAVAILAESKDAVLKHELLKGLSKGTGIPVSILAAGFGNKTAPRAVLPQGPAGAEGLSGSERAVLEGLLTEWPESTALVRQIPVDIFPHPIAREIVTVLKDTQAAGETLDFSLFQSHLGPDAGSLAAQLLVVESLPQGVPEAKGGLGRIHIPLLQLKIRYLEERAKNLQPEILRVSDSGGRDDLGKLMAQKGSLATEIDRCKKQLKSLTRGQGVDGRDGR